LYAQLIFRWLKQGRNFERRSRHGCVKAARQPRRALTTRAENPHWGKSGDPFIKSTMELASKLASIRLTAAKALAELRFSGN
jgi:hypothetical protein